jgi:ribosome biogenesis GTPase A
MCCLPNRFPLPIFLLINKCDLLDRSERRPWLEKFQMENYISENQFFRFYYISTSKDNKMEIRETLQSSLSNSSVEIDHPLKEMIKTILNFKDLREKFIGRKDSIKISRTNSLKSSKSEKKEKCFIL